jgi:hypothetical protein
VPSVAPGSGGQTRQYRMNRQITTVKVAWEEWKVGIHGNPSIESLISAHGERKWRMFPILKERNSEAQWFRRRKSLIKAIKDKISAEGISAAAAVDLFEEKRGSKSLDYMQKRLVKGENLWAGN